jgi:hypothetical protein
MKQLILMLSLTLAAGCSQPKQTIPYDKLLSALTNINAIARLDLPNTAMISSSDLTGANEDYNHFQGKTKDGWVILADLRGPGLLERFWFTGFPADAPFRFFFDGAKEPLMEFSWNDLVQGYPPFDTPPVSIDEQNCWHTFLPIPFNRRLLIVAEDRGYKYGQSPKAYYQINWRHLPQHQTVESLTLPLSPEHRSQLQQIAAIWEQQNFGNIPVPEDTIILKAGETTTLWEGTGPATLQAFSIETDLSSIESARERDRILRTTLLQIYWDDHAEPSVNVPLGDFFGSFWHRWRAPSMFFGSQGNTFFARFPMPFDHSAKVVLVNESPHDFSVNIGTSTGPRINGGFFHAKWRNSPATAVGTPHVVLEAEGKGRYVGCVLAVVSADRSFWVLESDERMRIEGKLTWEGTGLEDYFNCGWYYGNVFARPLQGLPIKAPFRTVQYRLHPTEPVNFRNSFYMDFERGPHDKSRGAYESVAYYYLDNPQAANSTLQPRTPPVDEIRPYTLMNDLWSFERFDDLEGQRDYIDHYLEQFTPPFASILSLRRLSIEHALGNLETKDLLVAIDPFLRADDESLRTMAVALQKLYTEENAVLIQFYANMQSELYFNGERILTAGDPQQPVFTVVSLPPGDHTLAAASAHQQYPIWTQVALRDANGYITGTDGTWRHAINPSGNWMQQDYNDTSWGGFSGYNARVKGPPEEPYIWVNPDPFLDTLSQASGLRPSSPWPHRQGRVVYRKQISIK